MINSLHAAMLAGKGNDLLEKILDSLIVYTKNHFNAEEQVMRKHVEQHKKLTDQMVEFRNQFASGKKSLSVQLMNFLRDWLTDHILNTDK